MRDQTELDLAREQLRLGGRGVRHLVPPPHASQIRALFAPHNELTSLANWIGAFGRLLTLDLRHNAVQSCEGIGVCTRLRDLDVRENRLSDGAALAAALRPCHRLTRLDARFNPFSRYYYDGAAQPHSVTTCQSGRDDKAYPTRDGPLPRVGWRARVLCGAPRLGHLDGIPVDQLERSFCERMPERTRGGALGAPASSTSDASSREEPSWEGSAGRGSSSRVARRGSRCSEEGGGSGERNREEGDRRRRAWDAWATQVGRGDGRTGGRACDDDDDGTTTILHQAIPERVLRDEESDGAGHRRGSHVERGKSLGGEEGGGGGRQRHSTDDRWCGKEKRASSSSGGEQWRGRSGEEGAGSSGERQRHSSEGWRRSREGRDRSSNRTENRRSRDAKDGGSSAGERERRHPDFGWCDSGRRSEASPPSNDGEGRRLGRDRLSPIPDVSSLLPHLVVAGDGEGVLSHLSWPPNSDSGGRLPGRDRTDWRSLLDDRQHAPRDDGGFVSEERAAAENGCVIELGGYAARHRRRGEDSHQEHGDIHVHGAEYDSSARRDSHYKYGDIHVHGAKWGPLPARISPSRDAYASSPLDTNAHAGSFAFSSPSTSPPCDAYASSLFETNARAGSVAFSPPPTSSPCDTYAEARLHLDAPTCSRLDTSPPGAAQLGGPRAQSWSLGRAAAIRYVGLYKICLYFKSFVLKPIVLSFFRPTCIAAHCSIPFERLLGYIRPPPTSFLYAIHHNILAITISCKGQTARVYSAKLLSWQPIGLNMPCAPK